jgi:hypothetical protein
MNSALGLTADTDLSLFDEVFAFGAFTDTYRFEDETFQEECVPAWDAAHPDDPVVNPIDVPEGGPNPTVGLGLSCRARKMFTLAAEGAGQDLKNVTFQEGLDAVGEFTLPGFGPASLSEGNYDAQDDLLLWVYDPERSTSDKGYAEYEGWESSTAGPRWGRTRWTTSPSRSGSVEAQPVSCSNLVRPSWSAAATSSSVASATSSRYRSQKAVVEARTTSSWPGTFDSKASASSSNGPA